MEQRFCIDLQAWSSVPDPYLVWKAHSISYPTTHRYVEPRLTQIKLMFHLA
jgi:hypothetical protein